MNREEETRERRVEDMRGWSEHIEVMEKQRMYILVGFASGWEGEEGEWNDVKGEQHLL